MSMNIAKWETFEGQVFSIQNPVDIIALRMEVRQIARKAGLGLVGQSSFSIAASNLACKIGMDSRPGGQVKVGWQVDGARARVQLIMTIPGELSQRFIDDLHKDISLLVDKIDIHMTPENILIISMEQWAEASPANIQGVYR